MEVHDIEKNKHSFMYVIVETEGTSRVTLLLYIWNS